MDTYEDVIATFMHSALPALQVDKNINFEAVAAEVFGSKQRRQGPMPSPEVQVAIRGYIRDRDVLTFFIPWSGSKIQVGGKVDVLEFMAIKHLACLRESLARLGKKCEFHFRLEDATDFYLCPGREKEIKKYTSTMYKLIYYVLNGYAKFESDYVNLAELVSVANKYATVFKAYLKGEAGVEALAGIGWLGVIPKEQQEYYYTAYRNFYPNADHQQMLAEYFGITLARKKLAMTCLPEDEHIQISFTRPVPSTPVGRNRLYYRTIPERYTCKHRAPWVGQGYFLIDEEGNCCPKYVDDDTDMERLTDTTLMFDNIEIHSPYMLK